MCLFCQEKKRYEKERGEISSYSKIETQLQIFIEIDPTYIDLGRLDDGTCIAKTLERRNAVYDKKCYCKIGRKEYNRTGQRKKFLAKHMQGDKFKPHTSIK